MVDDSSLNRWESNIIDKKLNIIKTSNTTHRDLTEIQRDLTYCVDFCIVWTELVLLFILYNMLISDKSTSLCLWGLLFDKLLRLLEL